VDIRPLRESRDFRRLWIGQAVSYLGNMVTFVAVPIQLYHLTGSTLQVGLLSICDAVPLLLFSAIGGTIADALDRRRLAQWSETGLGVVVLLLAANSFLAEPMVWPLYALAFVGTSLWALGAPALRAMMPGLVPQEQLAASQALQSIYFNAGAIVGPAIGGILIATAGFGATYLIDVASFAFSVVLIALIAPAPPKGDFDRPSVDSFKAGFRFLAKQPVILGTFVLDTNAMVFGMPQALFPAVGAQHFDAGAGVVGFLYASLAVGALLASLLSGWMEHVRRQGIGVAAAIVVWGAAIAGFGFATALWFGMLMLAVAGAADSVSATLRSVILYSNTPDAMRGRMNGIELAQVASTPAIGNVEAGVVASLASLRASIVSGGVLCIVGVVAILAAMPKLVQYDAKKT
jgi:MFS family permease